MNQRFPSTVTRHSWLSPMAALGATLLVLAMLPAAALADDPFLAAATYFGGPGHEEALHMDLAPDGSIYIVGHAGAPAFAPMPGALNTLSGGQDIIVVKMSADLSEVIWSRYVGGVGAYHHLEYAADCAATADGGVVVTGTTETPDFPTVNALDDTLGGPSDAVLFKVSAEGDIVFSTYIGGSGDENGDAAAEFVGEVEVAADGSIFLAGDTRSDDFPLVSPIDSAFGGFQPDVFMMKLSADAQTILASTYLGDVMADLIWDMDLDPQGRPVIMGEGGPDWPSTPGGFSFGTPSTSGLLYVTTFAADAQSIVWSARVNRSGNAGLLPRAMAINDEGVVTVVGSTSGSIYPVPPDASDPDFDGSHSIFDVIALQFSPDGSSIVGGTYVGVFNGSETSIAIDTDSFGNVVMTTHFLSEDSGLVRLYKFNPSMTELLAGPTVIATVAEGLPLRVDENNNVVAPASTWFGDTTPGAFDETQPTYPGPEDVYLARWDMHDPPVVDPVRGDLTGDGVVNVFDLLSLLGEWGACADPAPGQCHADLTEDGTVNVFDLLELLGAWG